MPAACPAAQEAGTRQGLAGGTAQVRGWVADEKCALHAEDRDAVVESLGTVLTERFSDRKAQVKRDKQTVTGTSSEPPGLGQLLLVTGPGVLYWRLLGRDVAGGAFRGPDELVALDDGAVEVDGLLAGRDVGTSVKGAGHLIRLGFRKFLIEEGKFVN